MPKKVPSEFTGRFSIKPKQSRSKLKTSSAASSSKDTSASPYSDHHIDELIPFRERKRKKEDELQICGERNSTTSPSQDEDEGLEVYSRQLEVQSPQNRPVSQQSSHVSRSTDQSFPSPPQFSTHKQWTSSTTAKSVLAREKLAQALGSAWSKSRGSEYDVSSTAYQLAHFITTASNPEDVGDSPHTAVAIILDLAFSQPPAIDFLLKVHDEASKLLSIRETNLVSAQADYCIHFFKEKLTEAAAGLQGQNYAGSLGNLDTADRSYLRFRSPESSGNLDGVMTRVHDERRWRRSWILAAGMYARCLSLRALQIDDYAHALNFINLGLNARLPNWCKADLIGVCVLLRGCAKSLLESLAQAEAQETLYRYRTSLESFLLQGNDMWDSEFMVKSHASLALHNLVEGPSDESSEQLFAAECWVF